MHALVVLCSTSQCNSVAEIGQINSTTQFQVLVTALHLCATHVVLNKGTRVCGCSHVSYSRGRLCVRPARDFFFDLVSSTCAMDHHGLWRTDLFALSA